MMLTLLASISVHLSVSQNIESGKSHELQVDEYKFPHNSFDKNFMIDTTWSKPEARLHRDLGRRNFESRENPSQRNGYTKYHDRIPESPRTNMYFPFDSMPILKPYGLYSMPVTKPDPDWRFPMPIK
jgi:hypothetical protein